MDFKLAPLGDRTAVIVENFYEDPDAVRAFALTQEFVAQPQYHKGKRTLRRFLFPGIKERFEQILGCRIKMTRQETVDGQVKTVDCWDTGVNGVFQSCIGGDQLVYHSDMTTHAAAVYLSPDAPPRAGTSLIRSAATKGRTVEESAKLTKLSPDACQNLMYTGKLLDRMAWEEVDHLGNVYNRLVLWNGRMTHTATEYFGHDLQTSRLFQLFFFEVEG